MNKHEHGEDDEMQASQSFWQTFIREAGRETQRCGGGWVNYFRVGNASRAFSEVRDYLEMKVRTLLTRRERRQKTSVGWRRWSNEYHYGVLGLFWDWKTRPLSLGGVRVKVVATPIGLITLAMNLTG